MSRDGQNGFSLIEALVAMTVLAVSATAILSAAEAHTRSISAVQDRSLARWVAQNAMATVEQGHQTPAIMQMGGADWQVRIEHAATSDTALGRVDVSVARSADPGAVLARLTGFVDLTEASGK